MRNKKTIILIFNLFLSLIVAAVVAGFVFAALRYSGKNAIHYVLMTLILVLPVYGLFFRVRRRSSGGPLPESIEGILQKEVKFYSALDQEGKQAFVRRVREFLEEVRITGVDTDVSDRDRVLVAASAVIPVFAFPEWRYHNLEEVLLYPGTFSEDFSVEKKGSNILGMVGIGSSMILSRPSLETGFKQSSDKRHVGYHEFAHIVDGADSVIDGVPELLLPRSQRARWRQITQETMAAIDAGRTDINPYALTNEAEFFAVTSEYFFENPAAMAKKYPRLYAILQKMYRQDTLSLLSRQAKKQFRRLRHKKSRSGKPGRNDPCPCGSGKKYKHCCLP